MSRALLMSLAISLGLTLFMELTFFWIVRAIRRKLHTKDLLLTVMVNLLTNPAVVLLYWLSVAFTDINRIAVLVFLELSAVLIEGYLYQKHGSYFQRPYLFSFAANAVSFGLGMLIQIFF